jgi:hypothetical protein
MPNEVKFDAATMTWTQVAQNRQGEIVGQRSVSLPSAEDDDSLYKAVESFAGFADHSGGDSQTSVLSALDDVQQAAREWMTKVDKGASQAEINLAGNQLNMVIKLSKALESYYVTEYEYRKAAGD